MQPQQGQKQQQQHQFGPPSDCLSACLPVCLPKCYSKYSTLTWSFSAFYSIQRSSIHQSTTSTFRLIVAAVVVVVLQWEAGRPQWRFYWPALTDRCFYWGYYYDATGCGWFCAVVATTQ